MNGTVSIFGDDAVVSGSFSFCYIIFQILCQSCYSNFVIIYNHLFLLDCNCNQDQHVNVAHPLCSCHLHTPPSPKERRHHSRRSSLPRRASCFCSSLKLEKEALVIMDCRQVVSRLLTASCIADRPRIVTPVATWFCFCLWHWLSLISDNVNHYIVMKHQNHQHRHHDTNQSAVKNKETDSFSCF